VVRAKEEYISSSLVKETIKNIENIKNNYQNYDFNIKNKTLKEIEKEIIKKVLKEENNNKTKASQRLNIGRTTLWRKLNE